MQDRRQFVQMLASAVALQISRPAAAVAKRTPIIRSARNGAVRLPVVGMGSWLTFDCANDPHALGRRTNVLREFFAHGGSMIDSSPMYGTSQQAIGHCLESLAHPARLYSATKVWTRGRWLGERQMRASARLWGIDRFDLMQIHNLVDAQTHLETLAEWKADGRIGHIGITTSHGRRHDEVIKLMERGVVDFVQVTYNIVDRDVEARILPIALERDIGVIVNRPFRRSRLFDRLRGRPLPTWAQSFDCTNWAQFLLKYIISHRAVTCVIPATSRADHMVENMGAQFGRLPNPRVRREMAAYFADISV